MFAIAPNLTAVVGELIGARLISHAGSLFLGSLTVAPNLPVFLVLNNLQTRALCRTEVKTQKEQQKVG